MAEAADQAKAQVPLADGKDTENQPQQPQVVEPALPKLSAKDFKEYNHIAEMMNWWHNTFRAKWTMMHDACVANKRPHNMSIKTFLATGLEFCHHLTEHHSIEEAHLFPVLAKRMPAFRKELELLTQHKAIHAGVVKLQEYLLECKDGKRELRLNELQAVMDPWGEVLWQHLDDEVEQLKAENMRKYWSLEEMKRMPM